MLKDIRYIKHNDPQSTYALHILNNKHEYSPINNTMTLLKHINKTTLLIPMNNYTSIYTTTNSSFQNNT